jgi:hypothetical protein
MRVEQRDGKHERRLLIGLIVDQVLCGHVAAIWTSEGLFQSKWANLIAGWCVRYFRKYNKPPGGSIESMFEVWAEKADDKETVKLVERFLDALSGEYEQEAEGINSDYLVDRAAEYFDEVRLRRLAESIQVDLSDGDRKKAIERVSKFDQVQMGNLVGVDVLRDVTAIREAFEQKHEPIIQYPGALGNFFADAFERDSFIALMGPEKRGKSWWLIDIAWRAMLQRRKVVYFSVGDMSQHQMMRRIQIRAAKRPLKPRLVKYPTFISYNPGEACAEVDFTEHEFTEGLTWRDGVKACRRVITKTKSDETLLKLACYPNSTMSVAGLSSVLSVWARSNWVPDVVVIDYADILANPPGYRESRDAINETWKALRALSQSLHCCVVTATQADAASYRSSLIDASNFSEDKRKLAHVTGMVGLNATPDEKHLQLMRLNWVVLRESEFTVTKCVHVAGCLHLGNPAVMSTF